MKNNVISPTVLAHDAHEYREQIERILPFAKRIQVDIMDGTFAKPASISLDEIWLPEELEVDLHLMMEDPQAHIERIIELGPSLVIVHAESTVDIPLFASRLREVGIKSGIAILPETKVSTIAYALPHVQHLLIFGGHLGSFGGKADVAQADKAQEALAYNKWLEIGWDGGANDTNAQLLFAAGISVLNVGSFIQKSENPKDSFILLQNLL